MLSSVRQIGRVGAAWLVLTALPSGPATAQYLPQPGPGGPNPPGWQHRGAVRGPALQGIRTIQEMVVPGGPNPPGWQQQFPQPGPGGPNPPGWQQQWAARREFELRQQQAARREFELRQQQAARRAAELRQQQAARRAAELRQQQAARRAADQRIQTIQVQEMLVPGGPNPHRAVERGPSPPTALVPGGPNPHRAVERGPSPPTALVPGGPNPHRAVERELEAINERQRVTRRPILPQIAGPGARKISARIQNVPSSIGPRPPIRKPAATKIDPRRFSNKLIVKIVEGSAVRQTQPNGKALAVADAEVTPEERARLGRLGLHHGQVRQHLDPVNRLLQDDAIERVEPVFRAENEARIAQHRAEGKTRSGVDLADLGLYFHIMLKPGTGTRAAERLIDRLNASPIVEIAYPAPIARLGGYPQTPASSPGDDPQTPAFDDRQRYFDPAPLGIDAAATWSFDPVGGRGTGVRVADTEGGWGFDHEDFPRVVWGARSLSRLELDPASVDHGTAVCGIIAAQENDFGVTGIVPRAQLWVSPIASFDPSDLAFSIYAATWQLGPGDVMIILEHFPGPESPSPEDPTAPQAGYVPVEVYPATSDAVRYATARGIIVVEIAGNGGVDFDKDLYYMLDRTWDSGAIIVGAARSDGTPEEFSNTGRRVDLNCWGSDVMTLGYGAGPGWRYLIGGDPHRCYRTDFNGTCSAASIVTGAVASLQGVVRNQVSASLSPSQMRHLLAVTGTPQAPGRRVGPRPDLRRALALLWE